MNLTQNEATSLLRAGARPPASRERCPAAAEVEALFTSIAKGLDREAIADHLPNCAACLREVDALLALFRGRRDVEIAPLSPESRPPRGLLARLRASFRRPESRRAAALQSTERALRGLRETISKAHRRLGDAGGDGAVDGIADAAIAAGRRAARPDESPEISMRAAVRAAFDVAAHRFVEASRATADRTSEPVRSAEADILRDAVVGLADRRRQVVVLHLVGLRLPEIAIALAYSDDQARNLLLRGLRELGAALAERGIVLE
jgi:hypothetical protein